MTEKLWPDAVAKAKEIDAAANHLVEDRRSDAWEALRRVYSAARKDPSLLRGHAHEDMQALLALAAERGTKKRTLKNQAKETLEFLLGSPSWLAAAQASSEVSETLRAFFEGNDAMLEKLATPAGEEAEEETAAGAAKSLRATVLAENAGDQISKGWNLMAGFNFAFPQDAIKGMEFDEATAAFEHFFKGVQKLPAGQKSEVLDKLSEQDFENFLQFAQGLLAKRRAYQNRVKFVVKKWSQLSPGFKEASDRQPLTPKPSLSPRRGPSRLSQGPEEEDGAVVSRSSSRQEGGAVVARNSSRREGSASVSRNASHHTPRSNSRVSRTSSRVTGGTISIVVWVDDNAEAYRKSALNIAEDVLLQGFHDDEGADDYETPDGWVDYVRGTLRDHTSSLLAVVLKERHLDFARNVVSACVAVGQPLPKFIVITGRSGRFLEGWDVLNQVAPTSVSPVSRGEDATQACLDMIVESRGIGR